MADGNKPRRRWGDRRDARWVREVDDNHFIMPYLMGNRTESEANAIIPFDITDLLAYREQINSDRPDSENIHLFYFILSALSKVMVRHPEMNRFIEGRRTYQRHRIELSFLSKSRMETDAPEDILFLHPEGDWNLITLSEKVGELVGKSKSGSLSAPSAIGPLRHMPRFMVRMFTRLLKILNYYGRVPASISDVDPYFSSVLITNLGSIGAPAIYHHLSNYGTCSVILAIGTMYSSRNIDGEVRTYVDLGFTVDERIADGYFFSVLMRELGDYLEHPEKLMKPFDDREE